MTLVVALVVMLMLAVMGGVVVSFAQSNATSATRSADTSVGDAVAEAAMSHARSLLWSAPNPLDPNAVPQGQVKLFGGTGTYSGQLNGNVWTLTGVSNVTSGAQEIARTVSTQVAVEAGGAGSPMALFSEDSDCGGDSFSAVATEIRVDGAVRSNGDFQLTAERASLGAASSFGPPCETNVQVTEQANLQTLASSQLQPDSDAFALSKVDTTMPIMETAIQYWPSAFTEVDFVCTYREVSFRFTKSGTIPPGVYCADESFIIKGSYIKGEITAIAPKVLVTGYDIDLEPYAKDVLLFATGEEQTKISASEYDWKGIVYHPNGEVSIAGDEFSLLVGMIEAKEIDIRGDIFKMIGTGPVVPLGQDGFTLVPVPGSYVAG